MFRVDLSKNRLSRLSQKRFSDLNLRERDHLQEWLAKPQSTKPQSTCHPAAACCHRTYEIS